MFFCSQLLKFYLASLATLRSPSSSIPSNCVAGYLCSPKGRILVCLVVLLAELLLLNLLILSIGQNISGQFPQRVFPVFLIIHFSADDINAFKYRGEER